MYDNATKDTWRGWAWNQIAKRSVPGATVMVLAGDGGYDIKKARRHGLRIIGVDRVQGRVNEFRRQGEVAIKDSLHRQVMLMKPDALIADMMGGMTSSSWGDVLAVSPICKAVVWNGLRGRDKGVNDIIGEASSGCIPIYRGRRIEWTQVGKHRGKIAFCSLIVAAWNAAGGDMNSYVPQDFISRMSRELRPEFMTYRSKDSGQYFDSVAWNWLGCDDGNKDSYIAAFANSRRVKRSKRKAAAAKAVMTRKIRSN